jgi:transcriptional regulator with XRE-family HTH domain
MQHIERSTNRAWLGEFLRSRRERLSPKDYGFPVMSRRRSPGLRRDEVAQLSGISIAYYTWIEQGREINMSADVLNSIARALGFSEAERAHLFALVGIEIAENSRGNDATLRWLLQCAAIDTACDGYFRHPAGPRYRVEPALPLVRRSGTA